MHSPNGTFINTVRCLDETSVPRSWKRSTDSLTRHLQLKFSCGRQLWHRLSLHCGKNWHTAVFDCFPPRKDFFCNEITAIAATVIASPAAKLASSAVGKPDKQWTMNKVPSFIPNNLFFFNYNNENKFVDLCDQHWTSELNELGMLVINCLLGIQWIKFN